MLIQRRSKTRVPELVAIVVVWIGGLAFSPFRLMAQETQAPQSDVVEDVQLEIQEVYLQTVPYGASLHGQLELRVAVSNNTPDELVLKPTDFLLTLESKPTFYNPAVVDPLISRETRVASGKMAAGWMAFRIQHPAANEPKMELTYTREGKPQALSVNNALRQIANLKTEVLGPNDCLALVSMRSNMDRMSIWLLNDEFRRIKALGIQRVVIDPGGMESTRRNSSPYRSSYGNPVSTWLASASSRKTTSTFRPRGGPVSPVRFTELFVVNRNLPERTTLTRSTTSRDSRSVYRASRELAVADALGAVYETATEAQALKDLNHDEPGVRRAAFESSVDRLTAEQLHTVLTDAKSASAEFRAMIAENLYRVTFPEGCAALNEMVDSSEEKVSLAALKSLVRSVSPAADESLKALWLQSKDDVSRRQTIVTAVIKEKAYRHSGLLSEFADQLIVRFTAKNSGESGSEQQLPVPAPPSRAEVLALQELLRFLREQDDTPFIESARRELLNITDPGMQDAFLDFVLATGEADAFELGTQYIRQRLKERKAAGGLTAEEQRELESRLAQRGIRSPSPITSVLLKTIKKYPDKSYATRLLEISEGKTVPTNLRTDAFRTALLCASDSQLLTLVANFDDLDDARKGYLLTQLALMSHPARLGLIEKCLQNERTSRLAIAALRNDHSPEAMQLVIGELDTLRRKVEAEAKKLAEVVPEENPAAPDPDMRRSNMLSKKFVRPASQLIDQLTGHNHRFIHPDARRVMNLLRRSPVKEFEQLARASLIRAARTTQPNLQVKISEAYKLQKLNEYDKSKAAFEEILEMDPFYVHAYTALASLNLREGDGPAAMENLKLADEMNPEDIHTQSMIALAEIRLGNITTGTDLAEQILESVPDMPTTLRCDTLYNTACTYGRAIEVEKSAATRKKYRDRAIELLTDCVNRENGFGDVAHILADPDLNAFHDDKAWPALIEKIGENEKQGN